MKQWLKRLAWFTAGVWVGCAGTGFGFGLTGIAQL